MELEGAIPSTCLVKCCDCVCDCSLMNRSYSRPWIRTVKRKLSEFEEENRFSIPDFPFSQIARVEVENECEALRDIIRAQQETIQELSIELEEERNASSSAVNETMSMILRLQKEKSEIQMEARQFKRFAEEKMQHGQDELSAMDELLYKREQSIQSLYCEIQAYKHRLMSYGLAESEPDGERGVIIRNDSFIEFGSQCDLPIHDYPPLKCSLNENFVGLAADNDMDDVEKYAFGESQSSYDHLKDIESRINQLENNPQNNNSGGDFSINNNVSDKVILPQSPRLPGHLRRISTEKSISIDETVKEIGSDYASEPPMHSDMQKMENGKEEEHIFAKVEYTTEYVDDINDRVYTKYLVNQGSTNDGSLKLKPPLGDYHADLITPKDPSNQTEAGDPEMKKLCLRLQALEADRESMRQAIVSMRTDKAQLVLLKEIAQHLCKDMSTVKRVPVKKAFLFSTFSIVSVLKWLASFIFWRRKAQRSKYTFGLTNNVGLLMLLDKAPNLRQWKYHSITRE
ncbi:myosin-binding protein 7-like [Impatiens glandulifera]|uniref:myosin-binding protein 7-like n=1 Tax=Impatiens glandulifera TaxID=253017 RepID=UPI001FB11113|nr:myosin-binding protein 7-like [Impatiens glandulifera]